MSRGKGCQEPFCPDLPAGRQGIRRWNFWYDFGMTMDELQPIPHTPDIRKVSPRPEMPGIVPPRPGKLPGEERPEINDEDDDDIIIVPPPAPSPEIRRDRLPGADHDDDDKDEGPPKPTRH